MLSHPAGGVPDIGSRTYRPQSPRHPRPVVFRENLWMRSASNNVLMRESRRYDCTFINALVKALFGRPFAPARATSSYIFSKSAPSLLHPDANRPKIVSSAFWQAFIARSRAPGQSRASLSRISHRYSLASKSELGDVQKKPSQVDAVLGCQTAPESLCTTSRNQLLWGRHR